MHVNILERLITVLYILASRIKWQLFLRPYTKQQNENNMYTVRKRSKIIFQI